MKGHTAVFVLEVLRMIIKMWNMIYNGFMCPFRQYKHYYNIGTVKIVLIYKTISPLLLSQEKKYKQLLSLEQQLNNAFM